MADHTPDAVVLECADASCGDTNCKNEAASCFCANCGHFAKIVMAASSKGLHFRIATPLNLDGASTPLPEGVSPSIDQPPRKA